MTHINHIKRYTIKYIKTFDMQNQELATDSREAIYFDLC